MAIYSKPLLAVIGKVLSFPRFVTFDDPQMEAIKEVAKEEPSFLVVSGPSGKWNIFAALR